MPKHLLPLRVPPESHRYQPDIPSDQTFDFPFARPARDHVSDAQVAQKSFSTTPRPTTAGGIIEGRTRKKLRLDIQLSRPKTSGCHKAYPSISEPWTTRGDADLIGVAFGSPGHPPMAFCNILDGHGSAEADHLLSDRLRPVLDEASWKRFFKGRSSRRVPEMITNSQYVQESRGTQNMQPLRRVPLPKTLRARARSYEAGTLRQANIRAMNPSQTSLNRNVPIISQNSPPKGGKRTSKPLPKLELEIPDPFLGRASTFWKRLPDPTSAQPLLVRRSKTLDNVSIYTVHKAAMSAGSIPTFPAPASLTPLEPPRKIASPASATKSPGGWSLFPRSASHLRLYSQATITSSPTKNPLRRTVTSPARLSPMQPHFNMEVEKPKPLQPKRNGINMTSPEEVTASTDRDAPWSSATSFQSPASSRSSVDEIFFDIKSFRGSQGIESAQFEMTRPDSAEVQLRRTQSKTGRNVTYLHPSTAGGDFRTKRTPQSITIDETIEAVKMLALSANVDATYEDLASERPGSSSMFPSEQKSTMSESNTSSKGKGLVIFQPSSAEDNISTTVFTSAVLSPVTERSERPSPAFGFTPKGRSNTNSLAATISTGLPTPLTPARASSEFGGRDSLLGNSPPPMPSLESMSTLISPSLSNSLLKRDFSPATIYPMISSPLQNTLISPASVPEPTSLSGVTSPEPSTTSPNVSAPVKVTAPPERAMIRKAMERKLQPRTVIVHAPESQSLDTGIIAATDKVEAVPLLTVLKTEPVQRPEKPSESPVQPISSSTKIEDVPPPVPPKDSKYIPISKFAAKSTVAAVTERTGIHPARPTRTTGIFPINPLASNPSNSTPRPVNNPTFVPALTQPQPAPEVSVARTVSVTRKPSARKYVVPSKTTQGPAPVPTLPRNVVTRSSPGLKGQIITGPSNPARRYQAFRAEEAQRSLSPNHQHLKMDEHEKVIEIPAARMLSPVVVQPDRGHKPGISMNLVFESA